MDRKINFCQGEIYHIYNRGVNKQNIFSSDHDRWRFLILLYLCNNSLDITLRDYQQLTLNEYFKVERGSQIIDILSFCLMPNHFHLIVKEKIDGGISKFMQKVLTGYCLYFNKKHTRTGPLFEGRFKAKHVDDDGYLEYLLAYIHLNPVKIKDEDAWTGKSIPDKKIAKEILKDYRFSSYLAFVGKERSEDVILNKNEMPIEVSFLKDVDSLIGIWSEGELEKFT